MLKITTLIALIVRCYTEGMKFFVSPEVASKPLTPQSSQVSLLFAGLIALMAVAQLFTFEDFIFLIEDLSLPLALPPLLTASFMVIAEVMALPFLLRMTLSPAFRWLSMALGWLVVVFWLFVSFWIWLQSPQVDTVGFLGAITLPPGPWMVLFSISLAILAIWSSWGLWPGRHSAK